MEGWLMEPCCVCSFYSVLETGDTAWERVFQDSPRGGELVVLLAFMLWWVAAPTEQHSGFMLSLWPCPSQPICWCGCCFLAWSLLLPYLWLLVRPRSPACELRALSSSFLPSLPQPACFDLQWPYGLPMALETICECWWLSIPRPCPLLPVRTSSTSEASIMLTLTKSASFSLFRGTETTIHHLPDSLGSGKYKKKGVWATLRLGP